MSHHNPLAVVFHESVRFIAMGKYEIGSDGFYERQMQNFNSRLENGTFKYL